MPISLPPLSRRQFIGASLAGLVAGRSLAAPSDPNSFALFSDTHIPADPKTLYKDFCMADRLTAAVKEVLALPTPPQALFIDGDLAYRNGQPKDYATFAGILKPVREAGLPIHLTLGNHDNRDNFLAGVPGAKLPQNPVDQKHITVVPTPRARIVMLDSLQIVDKAPGEFGPEQLRWLGKLLDAEPTTPTIIMGHHNPTLAGFPSLLDTDEFYETIARRKQVKAYIYGHTHTWRVTKHPSGIHLINLPAVAYHFDKAEATGWTLMTIKADGLKLHLHAADKHKQNGETHELAWR